MALDKLMNIYCYFCLLSRLLLLAKENEEEEFSIYFHTRNCAVTKQRLCRLTDVSSLNDRIIKIQLWRHQKIVLSSKDRVVTIGSSLVTQQPFRHLSTENEMKEKTDT